MTAAEPDPGDIRTLRDQLLEAALPHVVFDGWSLAALIAGASDIGLGSGHAHAAFINPKRDLVVHFSDWADRRMLDQLQDIDLESMKVRDRIATLVLARFDALVEHKEATRRAIALLALPGNPDVSARALYRTVDAIWRAAGDTAVDFSFYSKRGLLAAVLMATTLYWLNDRSPSHAETRAFLHRRIAGIMRIPAWRSRLRDSAKTLTRWRGLRRQSGL